MTVPRKTARSAMSKLKLKAFNLAEQLKSATDPAMRDSWPQASRYIGFPMLSERIDGFKNTIYALASASRMGKSTFALQLAYQLVRDNEDTHVLFVSLDQPARELNLKLVSMAGEAPIDYVLHPDPLQAEKYELKRERGVKEIFDLKDRLTVIDESFGALSLEDLTSLIDQKRTDCDGPLVVFLDPYYKLRLTGVTEFSERVEALARELKTLCLSREVGMFCTTRLAQGAGKRRPTLEDLEEQSPLLYDAQVILLSYCDYYNNADTSFMEWEWGTDDLMVPIVELQVAKNRMGGFSGRLYYRFYTSHSKFKECPAVEVDNYDKMLKNLQKGDSGVAEDSVTARFELIDEK